MAVTAIIYKVDVALEELQEVVNQWVKNEKLPTNRLEMTLRLAEKLLLIQL